MNKIKIDGHEIEMPNLSQLMGMLGQLQGNSQVPVQETPLLPKKMVGQNIIKRVIICRDIDARKAILGMEKRIVELETKLIKKKSVKKTIKKVSKKPTKISTREKTSSTRINRK